MSKISLRAYNREIEAMIERGHTEESIAHCKYILKTYPKHLDTYRLLGKAFLESQRYAEAADILTRILSVLPDDFVAQIGMSIIREDEGNLDAAIFHMEKAFEIQPSNAAIQEELRRLYGRRDGIEPPKLRLTRGALVRMYARGDLYRQAIAEARAAIKEDPQRLDLEIILARMFYQTGQKAEAAEICSRLVMKLPYCMEANRILAEVLPDTSRSDDAKNYQQRLEALEPYLAYRADSSQNIQQVPDNAVTLDRLEWIPGLESTQQPAWASTLGLEIEEKEIEQMPDWLSGLSEEKEEIKSEEESALSFTAEQESVQVPLVSSIPSTTDTLETLAEEVPGFVESVEENQPETETDLPDWMRDLGGTQAAPEEEKLPEWMQSSGWVISEETKEAQSPGVVFDETEESSAAPADIPEWLKDFAPVSEESNLPETQTFPDVLPSIEEAQKPAPEPKMEEELPDWLKTTPSGVEEMPSSQSQEPLPDWLMETTEELEGLPEIQGAEENFAEVEQHIADTQPSSFGMEITAGEIDQGEIAPTATMETTLEPSQDLENMDDAMAWLESLAARQGAQEETLLTKPEERQELPPEWIAQAATSIEIPIVEQEEEIFSPEVLEQQPAPDETAPMITPTMEEMETQAAIVGEEPIETEETVLPEPTSELEIPSLEPTDQMDIDSAYAWLESLAAKQGAEPETLLTSSEDRLESPPDWIQQEAMVVEVDTGQEAVEPPVEFNVIPVSKEITGSVEGVALSSELPTGVESETEWIQETGEVELPGIETFAQATTEPVFGELDEKSKIEAPVVSGEPEPLPDWLSSELSAPSHELEDIQRNLPDWLQAETPFASIATDDSALTTQVGETPPLPDWLKDLESGQQEEESLPIERDFNLAPEEAQQVVEISQQPGEMILQAQNALGKGQIEFALSIYQQLIEQDQKTDETIHDLRDALYRFPVESMIWQTLGDAYMRSNQVQEALDAFTKAEELLK